MKGDKQGYGTLAVTLHWVSAVLIIILLITGFNAAAHPEAAEKAALLRVHIPATILMLLATLARLIWWALDQRPEAVAGPKWQKIVSKATHIALYVVIIAMLGSGIALVALSGAAPDIFAPGGTTRLPNFDLFPPRIPHGIGARLLVALLILHIAAALYHIFLLRDGLFWRMWYRTSGDARK
ncbi:cytochrome b [Novosphingobium sp. RL4]|uniref:cytochrome b n=1 Tax=Novosphingobium sp. RL4 TaxID=3109595 RepID=UPI002D76A162|nr:cytochrome b/b6 domain-containing protein [Novosphingobium sp. RL4]WRT94422.1 cytochrome b/b6 domain-containing protein [Novosphingobium sp. RL4]